MPEYRVWVLEARVQQQYTAYLSILNRTFSADLSSASSTAFQEEAEGVQAMVSGFLRLPSGFWFRSFSHQTRTQRTCSHWTEPLSRQASNEPPGAGPVAFVVVLMALTASIPAAFQMTLDPVLRRDRVQDSFLQLSVCPSSVFSLRPLSSSVFQVTKIMMGSSLCRYFNSTAVFAFGYVDQTFFIHRKQEELQGEMAAAPQGLSSACWVQWVNTGGSLTSS